DPVGAAEVVAAHRDRPDSALVGIKVRVGRLASGDHGIVPLEIALEAAEATGLPLMVHIDAPPPPYEAVLERLRPGDALTHAFRPFPNTPIQGGRVKAAVRAARERGILFDIGHGMGSFSFDVARAALADGFAPDVISSDVHALSAPGPAVDLLTTMSKFLALGLPLAEVVRAATAAPAAATGRAALGRFEVGARSDVSLLALEARETALQDVVGETLVAPERLAARGLVAAGRWRDPA
ncbi:MAG: amidohydrolase family protein, partial [Pseudomonadota bacterium]